MPTNFDFSPPSPHPYLGHKVMLWGLVNLTAHELIICVFLSPEHCSSPQKAGCDCLSTTAASLTWWFAPTAEWPFEHWVTQVSCLQTKSHAPEWAQWMDGCPGAASSLFALAHSATVPLDFYYLGVWCCLKMSFSPIPPPYSYLPFSSEKKKLSSP